ncbi:MAG: TldD/PmbA family protein, partial [Nitrospinota bacterium]
DSAEVYIIEETSTVIEVKEQKVDSFQSASSRGFALRVLLGNRLGFAYTSDNSPNSIDRLIKDVFENARNNEEDIYISFAKPSNETTVHSLYDDKLKNLGEEEKIERGMRLERAALKHDKRIKKIRHASYEDSENKRVFLNSNGIKSFYSDTVCSTSILLVAEEGGNFETGWEFDYSRFYKNLKIEEVGIEAAEKAIKMLGAKRINTCRVPVIIDPKVSCDFLGILSSSLSADSVQKGKSMLADKLNSKIASPILNLIDDGTLDGGIGSAPVDGEGIPTKRTPLIEKGCLKGFLHNIYTANKWKTSSTGNSVRGGFKGLPGVGVTNLFVEKGNISREGLINGVDKGLYITEAMGVHTANPISGDFSIGIAGHYIENGKISFPVRGVVMAGNILELMKGVEAVADDLRFFGRVGSPSIKISEVVISGN